MTMINKEDIRQAKEVLCKTTLLMSETVWPNIAIKALEVIFEAADQLARIQHCEEANRDFYQRNNEDFERALGPTKNGEFGNWIKRAEKLRLDKEHLQEKLDSLIRASDNTIPWIDSDMVRSHLGDAINIALEERKEKAIPDDGSHIIYVDKDREVKIDILE